jgi:hypothetical protein
LGSECGRRGRGKSTTRRVSKMENLSWQAGKCGAAHQYGIRIFSCSSRQSRKAKVRLPSTLLQYYCFQTSNIPIVFLNGPLNLHRRGQGNMRI